MVRVVLVLVLLLSALPVGAGTERIGRLFFSPAERDTLDKLRQDRGAGSQGARVSSQITLDGFVGRSSGKTTAWINRLPLNENQAPQGIPVQKQAVKPSAVSLRLSTGKKIDLKAGQTFDADTGTIREGYDQTAMPSVREAIR